VSSYTIKHYPHGIAIFGIIPLSDMAAIGKLAKDKGFDLMSPGISSAIGANFVISNAEGIAAWKAGIAEANKGLGRLEAWLAGTDTGLSAKTIASVLGSTRVQWGQYSSPGSAPYDAGDFGRCSRLLDLMEPEGWRARLGEVATHYPVWKGLTDNWDELEALYRAKDHMALYHRIGELRGKQ